MKIKNIQNEMKQMPINRIEVIIKDPDADHIEEARGGNIR